MCGICGILMADPTAPVQRSTIVAMRDALLHRGPDDAGAFIEPGVGLGSRRLSIIDLSERGHMPMGSEDQRYWITYNGEVYNFRELRAQLASGYRFRSDTDTEVVLAAFIARGPAMLDDLNGMFSFAIWDRQEKTAFLARDRLGVKPLYYHTDGKALRFASEQKALLVAGVKPELDQELWPELLCFRYIAGERTTLRGIRSLLPGHYLTWRSGALRIKRWWNLAERAAARREALPRNAGSWYRELFDDSVDLRRIADVPVGVMLSGGLDSGSVAASLSKQAGPGVHGFTVSFDEAGYDETALARQVARRWSMTGHELRVNGAELPARLRQATRLLDAPLAHTNEPHILALSELARKHVKVLLSGEGADETLNGYVRYQPLRFPWLLRGAEMASAIGASRLFRSPRAKKLMRMLSARGVDGLVQYNACDLFPSELADVGLDSVPDSDYRLAVMDEARGAYPNDLLRQVMYLDQHTFLTSLLDRNDRMTMGASIECRVPFLDYRIVETLAALPTSTILRGGVRKAILRRAVGLRLPAAIHVHKKWGFGIPWHLYLRDVPELREQVERLPDCPAVANSPLDRRRIRAIVDELYRGDMRRLTLVRALLMISIWYDEVVVGHQPAAATAHDAS